VHLNKPWDSVQLLKLVLILRTYGTTPPKVGVDTRLYFCRPVWLVRLGTVAMAIAQWPKPTGQPRLYRDAAAAGPPRAGPGPPPLPRHVKRAACVDRCAQAETAELYDVYSTVLYAGPWVLFPLPWSERSTGKWGLTDALPLAKKCALSQSVGPAVHGRSEAEPQGTGQSGSRLRREPRREADEALFSSPILL
jgi:hypothetical protein